MVKILTLLKRLLYSDQRDWKHFLNRAAWDTKQTDRSVVGSRIKIQNFVFNRLNFFCMYLSITANCKLVLLVNREWTWCGHIQILFLTDFYLSCKTLKTSSSLVITTCQNLSVRMFSFSSLISFFEDPIMVFRDTEQNCFHLKSVFVGIYSKFLFFLQTATVFTGFKNVTFTPENSYVKR